MHNAIEVELKRANLKFESEYFDDYYVDFYVPEYKTVIEVDGPPHYIAPEKVLTQTSLAKHRILRKKGYKVINVPFFISDS